MGMIPKTQVGSSDPSRFLGIIGKISLAIFISALTDDHDAVLVRTNSPVGTNPVKLRLVSPLGYCTDFRDKRQG